ncbi:twin-arginine translocase TatA/TatE family subunit [Geminicoccaceae bacterium 1502E]|nr:twin-arginine translocase TatA/TatE family subunit [Geminicoccaceae bacterium 1502E]
MNIGIWQVVLVLLIVLILFGAGKLPKVMGDVAKGVKSFKAGLKDDEDEDETKTAAAKPLTAEKNESAAHEAPTKKDEPARS